MFFGALRLLDFASSALLAACSGPPWYPPGDMEHPVVPYQHRGVYLWQLETLLETYTAVGPGGDSSILTKVCTPFNEKNKPYFGLPADDPQLQYLCNPVGPRAYDVVDHLIVPLTDPGRYNDPLLQPPLNSSWKVPAPQRNSSMSELLNPKGLQVDIFVSWSWQSTIEDVTASLRTLAIQTHQKLNKSRPEEVVFWMCWMAINQHQIRNELHWDLSMAPFRLGLEHAKQRVLLLNGRWDPINANEGTNPLGQAWNHFEMLTAFTLGYNMWPIGPAVQDPYESQIQRLLSNYSAGNMRPDKRTGATEGDREMIMQLINSSLLGVEGMTKKVKTMVSNALEWYALMKIANATTVLASPELGQAIWPAWKLDPAIVESLSSVKSHVEATLASASLCVGLPTCQASIPQGLNLKVQLLDNRNVADNQLLIHETEVIIHCSQKGMKRNVFHTSCACPVQKTLSKVDCVWSLPRPQGSPSCWPAHETGKFRCQDHPPLPQVDPSHCQSRDNCTIEELAAVACESMNALLV